MNQYGYMVIPHEFGTGVAGAPSPSLVLGNRGIPTMGFMIGSNKLNRGSLEVSSNMAVLNENRIGVAGAPPPSLVLGNLCSLIK